MAADKGDEELSLSSLFNVGWSVQKKVERAELTASNKEFKSQVSAGIRQLEEATRLVSELSLFSKNENVEEIATMNLKYLLLPALLGDLVSQLMNDDRVSVLERAQVYFIDFLQRCKDYAVTTEEVPSINGAVEDHGEPPSGGASGTATRLPRQPRTMEQLAAERREKIARLKAKKQIETKLKELDLLIQSCDLVKPIDEETTREHILTLLKLWVYKALDNLSSLKQEIDLLNQMGKMKRDLPNCAVATGPSREPRPPMKPFVITKDMLKNKVFGAGYPSLPSMTVEEFFEQNYHNFPPPSEEKKPCNESDEEKEETEQEERERLKREREFDDFKDVNRRGWGNRKNKG